MKIYTTQEVEALIRKAIEMAREESFASYTDSEMSYDYSKSQIVETLLSKSEDSSSEFIPLDEEEETVYAQLFENTGYARAYMDCLKIVEGELGKMHKITCRLRVEVLNGIHYKQVDNYNKNPNSEKLSEKFLKRIK